MLVEGRLVSYGSGAAAGSGPIIGHFRVEILSDVEGSATGPARGRHGRAHSAQLSRRAPARELLPVTSMFTPPRVLSTRLLLLDFCY